MTKEEKAAVIQMIREKYSDIEFPDPYLSPLWYGRQNPVLIEDRFAVMGQFGDDDPFSYVQGVSNQYNLVHHEETLHHIIQVLAEAGGKEYGEPIITPLLIDDGAKMKVDISFPKAIHKIQVEGMNKGRPVNPTATMWNSYDTSKLFGLEFGGTDEVCSNGMVGYKLQMSVRKKHRMNLDVGNQAKALLEGMNNFSEQIGAWQEWAKQSIAAQDANNIMEALPFGKKHKEEILLLPEIGTGETLESWMRKDKVNVYRLNGITSQFLSHEVDSVMVRAEKGVKVAKVFHNMDAVLSNARHLRKAA